MGKAYDFTKELAAKAPPPTCREHGSRDKREGGRRKRRGEPRRVEEYLCQSPLLDQVRVQGWFCESGRSLSGLSEVI